MSESNIVGLKTPAGETWGELLKEGARPLLARYDAEGRLKTDGRRRCVGVWRGRVPMWVLLVRLGFVCGWQQATVEEYREVAGTTVGCAQAHKVVPVPAMAGDGF